MSASSPPVLLARALRHPRKSEREAAGAALTAPAFAAFLGKTRPSPRAATADGLWKLIRKVERSGLVDPVAFCEAVGALGVALEPDAAARQSLATELLSASLRLKVPSRRVFEAMPRVSWLDLDGIDGALPDGIDALDGIEQVTLRGAALREDTHMDQLASHSGLHTIQSFLPVSDLHLYDAISFARSLTFSGAASRVSDISALSGWRALEQLHLDSTAISDISALAGLPALAVLSIGNTQVTDLSPLARLPALRSLALTRLKITDQSVLADLPALTNLNLSLVPLDDLSVVSRCRGLRRLVLWGASDLSLAPLASLSLQTVEILYSSVTDMGALAGCATLQSLRLVGTELPLADRATLSSALPNLRIH